jgi:hypothetical protein
MNLREFFTAESSTTRITHLAFTAAGWFITKRLSLSSEIEKLEQPKNHETFAVALI